jgi:hypothetical protein
MPTEADIKDWKFRADHLRVAAKRCEARAESCLADAAHYRRVAAEIDERINSANITLGGEEK